MSKRVMAFVDGENLTSRYQEMLKAGEESLDSALRRSPNAPAMPVEIIEHTQDSFVWSHDLLTEPLLEQMNLIHVFYYTGVVGDEKVDQVRKKISEIPLSFNTADTLQQPTQQIIPRVHNKADSSCNSKVINMTIDVMKAALTTSIDGILLLSGDSDFVPLVREVVRTSKQMYVGAFSRGLSEELRNEVDMFIDLDPLFFG